jgi:hypothetical protein
VFGNGDPSTMRRSCILIISTTAYRPEISVCQQEITGKFMITIVIMYV